MACCCSTGTLPQPLCGGGNPARASSFHLCLGVASGQNARLWRNHILSMVRMDVRMPGIDGVEAFRRIWRHHPGVRVILLELPHRINGRHLSGDSRKPASDR
jgi:hypothetical protein